MRDLIAATSLVILFKLDSNHHFSVRMTIKFNGWPHKTIGHLFYAMSSFVHPFKAISEFKLELKARNAQFRSKSANLFVLCELGIWRMTLKNNRAPLLCYYKLCVSFQSHGSIQTGVTVRKRPIQVKINNFLSCATLIIGIWPWKTIGLLFYTTLSLVHHFKAIWESNWSYHPETPNLGQNWPFFVPWDLQIWGMTLKTIGYLLLLQALCIIL